MWKERTAKKIILNCDEGPATLRLSFNLKRKGACSGDNYRNKKKISPPMSSIQNQNLQRISASCEMNNNDLRCRPPLDQRLEERDRRDRGIFHLTPFMTMSMLFTICFCIQISNVGAFQGNHHSTSITKLTSDFATRQETYLYSQAPHKSNASPTTIFDTAGRGTTVEGTTRLKNLRDEVERMMVPVVSSSKGTSVSVRQHPIHPDWKKTRQIAHHMVSVHGENPHIGNSKIINETFRKITRRSFDTRMSSWEGVKVGLEIMELQTSNEKGILVPPYDAIPRSVCVQGLKALNQLMRRRRSGVDAKQKSYQAIAAFRILQRLCTGVGIQKNHAENSNNKSSSPSLPQVKMSLDERDFCMVLNGFVNLGQMNMAHRVVALQERTEHAPPLSPVTYSILVKGYGRLADVDGVDQVLEQAKRNDVSPDIIMCNSLIDAYINCNEVPKAHSFFRSVVKARPDPDTIEDTDEEDQNPTPNLRTYNTMLKGFVKSEDMNSALRLSEDMKEAGLWDSVTTNTLVSVAIASKKFKLAETILLDHALPPVERTNGEKGGPPSPSIHKKKKRHPHVEAYSGLVDGYAKNGRLNKALATLQMMRKRGVDPNEYTYTSLINALAKADKIEQAKKLKSFMFESDGIAPGVITYNALFTGMLDRYIKKADDETATDSQDNVHNKNMDEAMSLLEVMLSTGVRPNPVTVATLVEALGKCNTPRVDEAKSLIEKMDEEGFVSKNNARVSTALIRACGHSLDMAGAVATYAAIEKPDIFAFNALLYSLCHGGQTKKSLEVLAENAKNRKEGHDFIELDVATFSIVISSLLDMKSTGASKAAFKLYKDMKRNWSISPDTGLVDIVLNSMVNGGHLLGFSEHDIDFTTSVLHDARKLEWPSGSLRRREAILKNVLMGRKSNIVEGDDVDPLFKKKNWNRINSGFRLWGGDNKKQKQETTASASDAFLASKNWDSFDSSFRIL